VRTLDDKLLGGVAEDATRPLVDSPISARFVIGAIVSEAYMRNAAVQVVDAILRFIALDVTPTEGNY
jgi:hypothetical protein